MKVTKMEVNNYRLLKNIEIDLETDLSLIIGKNNCGKTSVLSVLNKFIGDKSSSNYFKYDDFNIDFKNKLFEAVEANDKEMKMLNNNGIELFIYIEYDRNDNLANINSLMLDLDPDNNTIVVKFEYTLSSEKMISLIESFSEYYNRFLTMENTDVEKTICFDNFMKKKHKRFFEISRKSLLFDTETQKPSEKEYRILESSFVDFNKIISFKYIRARRNTNNSDNDGTLSSLSSRYYEKIKTDDNNPVFQKFEDELLSTDASLTDIYQGIFDNVVKKIRRFGGIKRNETVVKIISTLSQQQLLKGNTTVVYEANNYQLPENYNGLGYLNLINIIFEIETILSEFRYDNDDTIAPADINLLFIEEPEAHTHPQMQYIFIKNIKKLLMESSFVDADKNQLNLQTIISTHSSHIVSECNFDDIKYLKKTSQTSVISKNLKDLETTYKDEKDPENNRFKFLKQYLTLNCSEIFFADKVILFEGDTERILLPAMMRKIDQEEKSSDVIPLLSQNISLIEVGAYSQIFDKFLSFIGIKTLIITDIDAGKEKQRDTPNKDGTFTYDIVACSVECGTHTTNGALKHYYLEPMKNAKGNQLDFFTEMLLKEKVLSNKDDIWTVESKGFLMIVYQTLENYNGKSYYPRSFEDAFFHINRQFIIDNKDSFISLKNSKKISQKKENDTEYMYDAYQIAENCIKSKSSFALDILINSKTKEGYDFTNWQIPKYIKEGLLWLREDLIMN